MANESRWTKWAQNGRLSGLVWATTFVAWITFKALKIPVEGLDTVFVLMSGAFMANLGITTVKPRGTAALESSKKAETDADA